MELEEANDASNNAPVPAISPAEPPYSTAVAKCKAPPSIAAPITSDGAATSHSTASESKESPNTTEGNGQRLHDAGKTPLLSTPPTTAKGTVTKEQPGVLLASGTYKRSSNPEESQADGADAELETIPGSGCQSSAERNIWSTFNPIWSCFDVKKARLPKAADREADWGGTVGRPDEIDKFLGLRKPANRKTMGYLRRSIEERLVMGGLVFIGPAGSGKSALLKVGKEPGGRHSDSLRASLPIAVIEANRGLGRAIQELSRGSRVVVSNRIYGRAASPAPLRRRSFGLRRVLR